MKKSVAGLAVPILILALSACSSDDAAEPITTPSPTDTAAVSDPAPESEPTPDEVAPPQEPAEPAEVEISLAPFEEPFTLAGPDADRLVPGEDYIDAMAPPSTWEIQMEGMGVEDIEVDDMPACAVVWGTATLVQAAEGGTDAPPPGVMAFTSDMAVPLPDGAGCASNGSGAPEGYKVQYFYDGTRVAVGDTFKFATSTDPLEHFEDPYLVILLEAGHDHAELALPVQS